VNAIPHHTDDIKDGANAPLTIQEFATIVREAINQPPWRHQADKEADYADGNQLDSELLRKQKMLGIPPAKENIIGPAITAVCGYEAKTRTDWRVTPDGDPQGQDVADAINYKLNQAERHSKADRAMSQAFRAQVAVGLGWVEVAKAPHSMMFPYQCQYVNRNEIWWDMRDTTPDLCNSRWLIRRRWIDRQTAAQKWPEHKEIILNSIEQWIGDSAGQLLEGGLSTGLLSAVEAQRAWTVTEDAWWNNENQQVCISEVWYRRWVPTVMLHIKGGRVVKYDEANPMHTAALATGRGKLIEELLPYMRLGFWMGPHNLQDGETPHPHQKFPYVPFWGYKEDMTNIPYGMVRDMLFPQDNLNSSIAKLRWGMSSVRTQRTKGAVAMTDAQFRNTIASVNADIILDAQHMAQQGATFKVERDFQLNNQQFQLMNDSRAAIQRVSGVTASFMGQQGTATSGLQEQTQLEQSQVSLADILDNFKDGRAMVGELLMAHVISDLGEDETTVVIEGDVINPPRTVVLNKPERDPVTGVVYRSNDIKRTRLMVALEDVPSSSSFRAQQLNALSESIKAATPEIQRAAMPFMIDLMDLPRKKQFVEAIKAADQKQDPEAMREQIKRELMFELKERELAMKETLNEAQIRKLMAEAVQVGVASAFAAIQTGEKIVMNPMISPVADVVMQQSGWQHPNPVGQDPNYPIPTHPVPVAQPGGLPGDTSPTTPMEPESAAVGVNEGMETIRSD
jgi:hypothetical protein